MFCEFCCIHDSTSAMPKMNQLVGPSDHLGFSFLYFVSNAIGINTVTIIEIMIIKISLQY